MRDFNYSSFDLSKIDNSLINLIASIYEKKGLFDAFLKNNANNLNCLIEPCKNTDTIYSYSLRGTRVKEARLEALLKNDYQLKNRDEAEVLGYRLALNIIFNYYNDIELNITNIVKLYNILFGCYNLEDINKFKKIDLSYFDKSSDDDDLLNSISTSQKRIMLDSICNEYNKTKNINPLLLIPKFTNDFINIAPFQDGNRRIVKLLILLLLFKSGFLVNKYISLGYKIAFTSTMFNLSLSYGKLGWDMKTENSSSLTKYLLSKISDSYDDFLNTYNNLGFTKSAPEQVNEAMKKLNNKFVKKDLIDLCPTLSYSSIEKQIARLANENKITKHINGKSTFYTKN